MLKNLFKSVKKLAKKAAPYAGLVAGAMGMNPWAAAGLGALIGGIGGGSKGAIGGGLGGYFGGSMFGKGNPLFGPKATGTGFFNFSKEALDKGVMENLGEALINKEKEGFMKYLPMVMAGSGLTYAMGGFDEDPIPEDAIPKEYEYDPDKDPLKNINKKFTDLYEQYVAIPSTSIYGHLQSLGKFKDGGGVASFAYGGPSGIAFEEVLEEDTEKNKMSNLEKYKASKWQELQELARQGKIEAFDGTWGAKYKKPKEAMEWFAEVGGGADKRLEEIQMGITYENMDKDTHDEIFTEIMMRESQERMNKKNGGVASFAFGGSPGGRIMGPGTGREDNIPGLIMDPTTGQTSDMVVSNNEHIVPEYTLYAMGGGDTEKGHEMLNQLRKKTRPMAANMGYDFTGAEQGKVMYG